MALMGCPNWIDSVSLLTTNSDTLWMLLLSEAV